MGDSANALDRVELRPLMRRTRGRPEVAIGLIDGPVAMDHADFARENICELASGRGGAAAEDSASMHGTFVAGVLSARRGSPAPGICPGCTLLVRPCFGVTTGPGHQAPSASSSELARALIETIDAGARLVNLSAALVLTSVQGGAELRGALDYAARRHVILVAAAGNHGAIGGSIIARHGWPIPVAACDSRGLPLGDSNLGSAIGRFGLTAPGDPVTSLGADGGLLRLGGTSVATAFVTGAIGLLWSEFPRANAADVKHAVLLGSGVRRTTVIPPLLMASVAYESLGAIAGKPAPRWAARARFAAPAGGAHW